MTQSQKEFEEAYRSGKIREIEMQGNLRYEDYYMNLAWAAWQCRELIIKSQNKCLVCGSNHGGLPCNKLIIT